MIPEQAGFFASNNLAVPAIDFEKVVGFDTSFPLAAGEDRELCHRWLTARRGMFYAPELIVYHTHWMNFLNLCKSDFVCVARICIFPRDISRSTSENDLVC